ncbi:serine hydrolase [Streptomyces sp. NBC_00859]|uniref:serine hydrolase n=1 Tax=Streptomyces sp. NBC_00859 TaxID=2903682 RepID=UPI00387031E0|nr:beta-lactamase family protein [Streptomyces sp. NBC_00859]
MPTAELHGLGFTFGFLLGETIRHSDGRGVDRLVREEIAGPLGIPPEELALGLPPEFLNRVATHADGDDTDDTAAAGTPDGPDVPLTGMRLTSLPDHPRYLTACAPGTGTGTARGLGRLYGALACGGALDGARLMSAERLRTAAVRRVGGMDTILHKRVDRSLGYSQGSPDRPWGRAPSATKEWAAPWDSPTRRLADPASRFSFALTKNRLVEDFSETGAAGRILHVLRQALNLGL